MGDKAERVRGALSLWAQQAVRVWADHKEATRWAELLTPLHVRQPLHGPRGPVPYARYPDDKVCEHVAALLNGEEEGAEEKLKWLTYTQSLRTHALVRADGRWHQGVYTPDRGLYLLLAEWDDATQRWVSPHPKKTLDARAEA